jgi:hypothetical protein
VLSGGKSADRRAGRATVRLPALATACLAALVVAGLALIGPAAEAREPAEEPGATAAPQAPPGVAEGNALGNVAVTITRAGFSPRVVTTSTCMPVQWTNLTNTPQRIVAGIYTLRLYLPVVVRAPARSATQAGETGAADVAGSDWGGVVPANGGTLARTFPMVGTYPYYLASDPNLRGIVNVAKLSNFSLEVTPEARMVQRGGQVSYQVRLIARGLQPTGVNLTVSDARGGTSATWSTNPVRPTGTTTLKISASGSAPLGAHRLTITGDDGCLRKSAAITPYVVNTAVSSVYLPVVMNDATWPGAGSQWRFGFNLLAHLGQLDAYDVGKLRAGWYYDWRYRTNPSRKAGLEYMHVVRVAQFPPDWNGLSAAVQANPGDWWFVGNEPDRSLYQDEATPAAYAMHYHDIYAFIKGEDITARVAPGGIVQPTPLRLQYLDQILAEYKRRYGVRLPADGWNVHNMILRERSCDYYPDDCWGAGIPTGLDARQGMLYTIQDNDNMTHFRSQIVAMRQWMKRNGYQNMPLIISEYGVNMPAEYGFDQARVIRYMYQTFAYMLGARDCSLGDRNDGCRLVQRWAWYSLNDEMYNPNCTGNECGFNGNLFDHRTRRITAFGLAYANRPHY